MDPILMLLLVMLVMMLVFRYFGNKQAQKAKARRDSALTIGTSVRTHAGYYGTIVDIDGDTVTLESPTGDESVWHKNAIFGAEEPPFALPDEVAEDEEDDGEPEYGQLLDEDETQSDAVIDATGHQDEPPVTDIDTDRHDK